MAEYIEREAAIERLKKNLYASNHGSFSYLCFQDAINSVQEIPAADVEPVVRCRDCIHAVEIEKNYISELFIDGTKQCELGRADTLLGYSIITNDGFCDRGERKDDDGNC